MNGAFCALVWQGDKGGAICGGYRYRGKGRVKMAFIGVILRPTGSIAIGLGVFKTSKQVEMSIVSRSTWIG